MPKTTIVSAAALALLLAACDSESPKQAVASAAPVAAPKPAVAAAYDWANDAATLCERQTGVWAAFYQALPDPEQCLTEETDPNDIVGLKACFEEQGKQLQAALPEQWRAHFGPLQTHFQTDIYAAHTLRYLLPVKSSVLHGVPLQSLIIDVNLEETDTFGSVEAVFQLSGSLKEAQTALQGKFAETEKFYLRKNLTEWEEEEFDSLQAALQSSEGLTASDVYSRKWQPQPMKNNADNQIEFLCMPVGAE